MSRVVRVRSVSRHGAVQELQARDHRWLADHEDGPGPNGLAPSPLELLLGSFAAWTAIGILDLAREREWAVDAVEVEVALTQAADEAGAGGLLVRETRVRGELDDAERRELERVVPDRWPRTGWLAAGELTDRFPHD